MPRREQTKPLDGDMGADTKITDIEKSIASRWHRKDGSFYIEGMKRQFIGVFAGFSVYRVSGEWIRDNLDVTFGTGGHGLVHCFIKLDEILIDDVVEDMVPLVLHEAAEFHFMLEEGMEYREAHEKATAAVKAAVNLTEDSLQDEIYRIAPERQAAGAAMMEADSRYMPPRPVAIR